MSFSFAVRGTNKNAARDAVATKMVEIVAQQAEHAVDLPLVLAVASAYIDALPNDDTKDVSVSLHGSVAWSGASAREGLTGISVGVSAYLVLRG